MQRAGGKRDGDGFLDGVRAALRRIFVEGDNFFAWAVPLYTALGIRVKVHLLFVLYVAVLLLRSSLDGAMGVGYTAMGLGVLFVIVLLHEYGHCFACRWVEGEADEVVLWPLGGLAMCAPPHTWRANLITTVGGPAVNVALWPISGAALLAAGAGWGDLVFNPLAPGSVLAGMGFTSWWQVGLFWFYYINLLLLGFNVLLPMFPLDGGRILQELLWIRMGYEKATRLAANIGLVLAVAVGVASLVLDGQNTLLLGIAIFAGFTCWYEKKRLEVMGAGVYGGGGDDWWKGGGEEEPRGPSKRELRRMEKERRLQEEEDRILAKIAREGMGSLTRRERKVLERGTERRRGG